MKKNQKNHLMMQKKFDEILLRTRNLPELPFTAKKNTGLCAATVLSKATNDMDAVFLLPGLFVLLLSYKSGTVALLTLLSLCFPVLQATFILFICTLYSRRKEKFQTTFFYQRFRLYRLLKDYLRYAHVAGEKEVLSVRELALATSQSVRRVKRRLRKMIRCALLPADVLDEKENMVFLSAHAREDYYAGKKKEELIAGETVHADTLMFFVERVRLHNDILPDRGISTALEETERILNRLVKAIRKEPALDKKLRRTATYYLPQLESLLLTYRDLYEDKKDLKQTGGILAKIIDGVNMLNTALKGILEDMVQETAMRVNSELSVLKTLLMQDGML
ncbi:MAG: hypothetical protein IK016_07325 [Lachnospiraceae bacterium]|nr:hypothetical protein [Lachnospiraceae bacterium]